MLIFKSQKEKIWFYIGIFIIFIVGSLLHFTYELSFENKFVALFSATNESVWEHLKLALFSTVFLFLIEYWSFFNHKKNYFLGKLLGILSMMAFITIIFYTYTGIIGHSVLFIDILLFLLGAVLNQYVFYMIIQNENLKNYNFISLLGILAIILIFFIFTFYPPHLPLFTPPTNH